MPPVDQVPLHLKAIEAFAGILCVSCLIFAFTQWSRRRSETGFNFGQTVEHAPLLGKEVLMLIGILLVLLSTVQLVGSALVQEGMIVTNEQTILFSFVASLILYATYFLSVHFFLKQRSMSILAAFGLRAASFKNGWLVALVALGAVLIPVGISGSFVKWIFEKWGFSTELQDLMKLFLAIENPFFRLAIGIIAVFGAPIVEETLFRGILYPLFKRKLGFGLAVFFTSALFAASHHHALTALPLMVLAIGLTLLYEWRGNLASCILMHSFFNLSSLIYSIFFGKYEDLSTICLPYFPLGSSCLLFGFQKVNLISPVSSGLMM